MDAETVIERFGTAKALAKAVAAKSGVALSQSAVYEWKRNGIPERWRKILAAVAEDQGVSLPRGFAGAKLAGTKKRQQGTA